MFRHELELSVRLIVHHKRVKIGMVKRHGYVKHFERFEHSFNDSINHLNSVWLFLVLSRPL